MNDYKIKSRIWIEVGDNVLLGEGRVRLLKAVDATGSLSKAAKSIGMSYKKAWTLIDAVNKSAKEAVVVTSIGGQNGGGTIITPYGKNLIGAFEKINRKCWSFLDQELQTLDGI
jgi:molybdate transport system regulatory protein